VSAPTLSCVFELLAYHVAVPLTSLPVVGYNFAQALYTTDTCEIYLTLAGSLLGAKSRVRGVCRVEQIQGYMLTQMWEDNLLKKSMREMCRQKHLKHDYEQQLSATKSVATF